MPDKNPYQASNTPEGWGGVVAKHVLGIAEFSEKITEHEGEYLSTLNDPQTAGKFAAQAAVYSRALWNAVQKSLPVDILSWGLGHRTLPNPITESMNEVQTTTLLMRLSRLRENSLPCVDRQKYLLDRWTLSYWWRTRAGAKLNSMWTTMDAMRMMGYAETFTLASSILDIELFDIFVGPTPQSRARKRIAPLRFYLLQYWMAWSLWQGEHSSNLALLKRRLGVSFGKTTMSKTIGRLKLKP